MFDVIWASGWSCWLNAVGENGVRRPVIRRPVRSADWLLFLYAPCWVP